tara:strand:+ start:316 stop:789 length:474 start_codon:yes stop_codon:yes gene_type:complete
MITGVYGSNIDTYLTLEEKRINTSVDDSKIRYLFKLTNDMTNTVKYVYGLKSTTKDRFVKNTLRHNTTDSIFENQINLKPYGFWKYEVYEVSWIGTVSLTDDTAPNSETEVLETANTNGVVQGKVEEGKLYVQETSGSEQVRFTEHTETTKNYLYTN